MEEEKCFWEIRDKYTGLLVLGKFPRLRRKRIMLFLVLHLKKISSIHVAFELFGVQ